MKSTASRNKNGTKSSLTKVMESRHDKVKQSIERLVASGAISQPPLG